MALEYDLHLATSHDPQQLLERLRQELDLAWNNEHRWLVGPAILIGALANDERRQDLIEEGYGFRPSSLIWFRSQPRPDEDAQEGYRILARAVAALLGATTGDAILLFNGESPILQQRAGRVTIAMEWRDWLERHHASLSAYTVANLPRID